MYTVLILNKRSSDLLKDYKFLFKPFIDKGELVICGWNESGTDVRSSLPDLYKIIKGKKEWRAVVVSTDSITGYRDGIAPDAINPFDFSASDTEELPHISPIPLIRLTHIIGGYTSALRKEFEKGFEYVDAETGLPVRVKEEDLTTEELQDLSDTYEDGLIPVYIEKKSPAEAVAAQEMVEKQYAFADTRPREILLVSTRRMIEDNERARIRESWQNRLEATSSAFWERNKYPNNCRFLFSEIANADNSMYDQQVMEFWLSVLTLATNKIAASSLQAYRLYRLSADVNRDALAEAMNNHLDRLECARVFVQEQLRMRPDYSFEEEEELVPRQTIPVILEKAQGDGLAIPAGSVGLSRNCPREELSFWRDSLQASKHSLAKYLKTPRRAIDKGASLLKAQAESFYGDSYELDPFQVEDLNELMGSLEQRIVMADTRNVVDTRRLYEDVDRVDREVQKSIAVRMRRLTVILIGVLALLLTFAGYLPYVIRAIGEGSEVVAGVWKVTLLVLLVTALGGFIVLLVLRHQLVKKMKQYNKLMDGIVNTVGLCASRFSAYFSDVCTYMKAQSIRIGLRLRQERRSSVRHQLHNHRLALDSAIERAGRWMEAYDLRREADLQANVTTFFRVSDPPRENSVYYFPALFDDLDIPLNATGDTVSAPYLFVEKLHVVREDLFDEVEEK